MYGRISGALIVAILLVFFCACGAGETKIQPEREDELRELSEAFVTDLQREILPFRQDTAKLPEYGYVLYEDSKTYGVDALTEFFVAYQGKNDCDVTMVFAGSSFVAARVIFTGGSGYYLRYEYDKINPGEFSINGQIIDGADLKYQQSPPKWTFQLLAGKKDITFELKNPS